MEGAPRVESMEDIAIQPDLVALYGHQEVTLFGITKSLSDLVVMCPVDLADPRHYEAKNDAVVKAMNEADYSERKSAIY